MSLKESLAHVFMGGMAGFFSWVNPVIACILTVLFIVYQAFDYLESHGR